MPDKTATVTKPQQFKHYLIENADETVNVGETLQFDETFEHRTKYAELNMQLLCLL